LLAVLVSATTIVFPSSVFEKVKVVFAASVFECVPPGRLQSIALAEIALVAASVATRSRTGVPCVT
jgi:hypothetical protein